VGKLSEANPAFTRTRRPCSHGAAGQVSLSCQDHLFRNDTAITNHGIASDNCPTDLTTGSDPATVPQHTSHDNAVLADLRSAVEDSRPNDHGAPGELRAFCDRHRTVDPCLGIDVRPDRRRRQPSV
jgi:hypothetical protein